MAVGKRLSVAMGVLARRLNLPCLGVRGEDRRWSITPMPRTAMRRPVALRTRHAWAMHPLKRLPVWVVNTDRDGSDVFLTLIDRFSTNEGGQVKRLIQRRWQPARVARSIVGLFA